MKYLILSSTATAFLLFGSALLFGATGSVFLAAIARLGPSAGPIFWMGAGMFLIGVVFKLSLVPFHTWTPDVFEGAPLPVTAFMSVVTKAGTLAVFARFIYASLPVGAAPKLLLPVWIVAAISMIAGNVGMLAQTNLKRLLGYSSIAQVGYILVALAGGTPLGVRYAIYYLTAYALMNLGVLAVAAAISDTGEEGARAEQLSRTRTQTAVARGGDDGLLAGACRTAADRRFPWKDLDPLGRGGQRLYLACGGFDRRHGDLALRLCQDHRGDVRRGRRRAGARPSSAGAARVGERRALRNRRRRDGLLSADAKQRTAARGQVSERASRPLGAMRYSSREVLQMTRFALFAFVLAALTGTLVFRPVPVAAQTPTVILPIDAYKTADEQAQFCTRGS